MDRCWHALLWSLEERCFVCKSKEDCFVHRDYRKDWLIRMFQCSHTYEVYSSFNPVFSLLRCWHNFADSFLKWIMFTASFTKQTDGFSDREYPQIIFFFSISRITTVLSEGVGLWQIVQSNFSFSLLKCNSCLKIKSTRKPRRKSVGLHISGIALFW